MKDIIKQIFPVCFANNWYITCYIIFLFIYPFLNRLIDNINQKEHLKITVFSSALWIFMDYIKGDWFFPSRLILWTTIYFLIAYLKVYCIQTMRNKKAGIKLLIIGMIGYIAQVVVTNYVGLHISYLSDKVLRWNSNCCPFYIMIAIGGLIISLQTDFVSYKVNYISSLSLFVYLIHENYLFRTYTRPMIWQKIYMNIGYSHVVLIDLLYSMILFVISIVISSIYKETVQKFITKISDTIYKYLRAIYYFCEEIIILKIK